MYTKAWLEDENGNKKEIVSFGPLCVAPEYQRLKLGKKLIEHSFEVARKMGYYVNIIFGNPGNYVGSGFVSCRKKRVSCFQKGNYPTALLVCELVPGVLDGHEWMFIPSTAADCCDDIEAVEEFDKTFPAKEKKWMPSQEEFRKSARRRHRTLWNRKTPYVFSNLALIWSYALDIRFTNIFFDNACLYTNYHKENQK